MPNRPSKYSNGPTTAHRQSGGQAKGDVQPVYGYNEGTANEGEPTLLRFEDRTPAWKRFLIGFSGGSLPDVSGMNNQIALMREQIAAGRESDMIRHRFGRENLEFQAEAERKLQQQRDAAALALAYAKAVIENQSTKNRIGEETTAKRGLNEQEASLRDKSEHVKAVLGYMAANGLNPNNPEHLALADRAVTANLKLRAGTAERLVDDQGAKEAAYQGAVANLGRPAVDARRVATFDLLPEHSVMSTGIPGLPGTAFQATGQVPIWGKDVMGNSVKVDIKPPTIQMGDPALDALRKARAEAAARAAGNTNAFTPVNPPAFGSTAQPAQTNLTQAQIEAAMRTLRAVQQRPEIPVMLPSAF